MITGSALPRLLNCPSSEVLPHADSTSAAATAGNEAHDELANQVRTRTLPPELAKHVPPNAHAETKLVYDTATGEGRILGEAADRNYGTRGPFEIFMSADVLGVDGDTVVVLDWKTGASEVEPAATNGQLWALALAACRALGKHQAIVRIVYTAQGNRCDEHVIDALELAGFASRLERLHVTVAALQAKHAAGEQLDVSEGSWCRYCPARVRCPAKVALVAQVAKGGLALAGDFEMTPALAAQGYRQLVRVEQIIKEARQRLDAYVDEHGSIDLGDGRSYGRYVREGNERLSGDVATAAIADVLVDVDTVLAFEKVAIERKTSKAALDRAAKQLACKRGTASAIVKRIRELGGATRAPETMPIGEYVRDRNEPAEKPTIDVDAVNKLLESA